MIMNALAPTRNSKNGVLTNVSQVQSDSSGYQYATTSTTKLDSVSVTEPTVKTKPVDKPKHVAFGTGERRRMQVYSKELLDDLNEFTYLPDARYISAMKSQARKNFQSQLI
jgi:hypothetical protein